VVTLRVLRKCDPRQGEYIRVKLTTRDKLDDQRRVGARAPWQSSTPRQGTCTHHLQSYHLRGRNHWKQLPSFKEPLFAE
jgi:hypothetical protein